MVQKFPLLEVVQACHSLLIPTARTLAKAKTNTRKIHYLFVQYRKKLRKLYLLIETCQWREYKGIFFTAMTLLRENTKLKKRLPYELHKPWTIRPNEIMGRHHSQAWKYTIFWNKIFFFPLELYEHDSRNLSYYNVHSVTKDNSFFDFPVNIWVASFMVYAFHGSTLLQSGIWRQIQQQCLA